MGNQSHGKGDTLDARDDGPLPAQRIRRVRCSMPSLSAGSAFSPLSDRMMRVSARYMLCENRQIKQLQGIRGIKEIEKKYYHS